MRYWIAQFGPIEIGRVTELNGPEPYFVTVNAVSLKGTAQPETAFIKSFADFYEAKLYAVSFFPQAKSFIEWTQYES